MMKSISSRNIARIISIVLIIGGGIYRYFNPQWYNPASNHITTTPAVSGHNDIVLLPDLSALSGVLPLDEDEANTNSPVVINDVDVIKQLIEQLNQVPTYSTSNPFGEEYVTVETTNTTGFTTGSVVNGSIHTGSNMSGGQTTIPTPEYATGSRASTADISPTIWVGQSRPGKDYVESPKPTTTNPSQSPTTGSDNLTSCTTPRGKQIAAQDRTLAFKYNKSVNNSCIIEKRICSEGILGGSYTHHTCYFDQTGGYFEYLGHTGVDSSVLIRDTEIMLGIDEASNLRNNLRNPTHITIGTINNANTYDIKYYINYTPPQFSNTTSGTNKYTTGMSQTQSGSTGGGPDRGYKYVDDTTTTNYRLIEGSYQGPNTPDLTNDDRADTQSTGPVIRYNLGPIVPRTPEPKISDAREAQINPNGNGVQGVINNTAGPSPTSYTTFNGGNGTLSSPSSSPSCDTPRGYRIQHNQHVIAFERSVVPQGQICKYEYRTCSYGYLRGSYIRQTCNIAR